MNIVFKNENLLFKLDVRDKDGVSVVAPADVQKIAVTFTNEKTGSKWLEYRYPSEPDFEELTLEGGFFRLNITTEQAEKSQSGATIVMVNYHVADTSFEEGFNSFTQKGRIFLIKEV